VNEIDHNGKNIIDNIYVLAKLKGITIKALEEKCDLGQGYLSRIKRQGDGTSMPVVTVEKIAKELECSIGQLLYYNFSVRNEEEAYYMMLIRKLENDTENGRLLWSNVYFQFDDDERQIVYPENIANHPLKAILRRVWVEKHTDKEGKERSEGYGYCSFIDEDIGIGQSYVSFAYSCFLDNDVELYLLFSGEFEEPAELIMVKNDTVYPLCGNINDDCNCGDYMFCDLGHIIHNTTDCKPHLTDEIKKILNDYVFDEK